MNNQRLLMFVVALVALVGDPALGLDLKLYALHMLDGKNIAEYKVPTLEARLSDKFWADPDGTFPTLEVSWQRQPHLRYSHVVVIKQDGKGQRFARGANELIEKRFDDEKNFSLSIKLKDFSKQELQQLKHVELRFDHTETRKQLDEDVKNGRVNALNERAWYLATFPLDKVRNGQQAVIDATKSVNLAMETVNRLLEPNSEYGRRDTLAAAYAETGDFQSAIKEQKIAMDVFKQHVKSELDQPLLESERRDFMGRVKTAQAQLESHLSSYQKNQKTREWKFPYLK